MSSLLSSYYFRVLGEGSSMGPQEPLTLTLARPEPAAPHTLAPKFGQVWEIAAEVLEEMQ